MAKILDKADALTGMDEQAVSVKSTPPAHSGDCQSVIEIGTNSVKLLVAKVTGRHLVRIYGASVVTRLGQGLAESRQLRREAIDRTARVVMDFAEKARKFQPARLRVIATCAAREAVNQLELFDAVAQGRQLDLEVVSGEQEAEWSFQGVLSDPGLAQQPLLLVDLGGGSTEVILGEEAQIRLRGSFPIGCLRLLETISPADPPNPEDLRRCQAWLAECLERDVAPQLVPVLRRLQGGHVQMVSVGGTAAVVATLCGTGNGPAADDASARNVELALLDEWVGRLWSLSLAERVKLDGLPAERADTILTGSVVLQQVMRRFGFGHFRFSTRGVRYGALLDSPEAFRALSRSQVAEQRVRTVNQS